MRLSRPVALALMIVLGVFAAAVAGGMTFLYFQERRDGVLTSTELDALKSRLEQEPENEQLLETIREKDAALRARNETNRRRMRLGAYLLLGGGLLFLMTANQFAAARPRPLPTPASQGGRSLPRDDALGWGALVFTGVALAALFAIGAVFAPRMPLDVADAAEGEAGAVVPPPPPAPPDALWPCFRGPGNIGVAEAADYPTTWSVAEGRNVAWSVEVPVTGKSSPVVWGDRIFISGGDLEEQRVVCFDRATGALLWNARAVAVRGAEKEIEIFESTGFAAPTPVVDRERVVAMYATGLLAAFSHEGEPLWTKDLGVPESMYGFATSLVLYEDRVILQFDQGFDAEEGKSFLYAFDVATGSQLYKTPRPVPNSWSTPALIETPERVELITTGAPWVIAYDPMTGAELWRADGLYGDVAPSPAFAGGVVFVTNDQAQTMAIRPGGAGDVTETNVLWTSYEGMPDTSSPVADGERLLQVAAGGWITCLDAADGALLWEDYLESQASASPILAGPSVYLPQENGVTLVLELNDEAFAVVDRGDVGEPVYATPAFTDGRIYLRGDKHLFCIEKTAASGEESDAS